MNNTLKSISSALCKPVLAGLERAPKTHILTNIYGKPSLMTAMYHVMGFDGKKLERVLNVNEEALKKYCFFLVRPFYHNLHVTMYINNGRQWDLFGVVTARKLEFEPAYRNTAFKEIPSSDVWRNQIRSTGIVNLKPPTSDVLPSMSAIIKRFGHLPEQGQLGEFVLEVLDGMTRSGDIPTYIRAAMSVLHFDANITDAGITVTSDIDGATVCFGFAEFDGAPPVPEMLSENAKISDNLKKIREVQTEEYASFFDIVMLRAMKNALVIIPFSEFKAHSIQMTVDEIVEHGRRKVSIDSYMRAKTNKGKQKHIRIWSTIEVKE